MLRIIVPFVLLASVPLVAQVHYHEDGQPWKQRARTGPDKEVPGWYYNLGITGLRVELVEAARTHLVVRHVFEASPAHGKVMVGDHIVGADGKRFEMPHRNGYGMDVFGPEGPILDFALALEQAVSAAGKKPLTLTIERGDKVVELELALSSKQINYSATFPADCKKSDRQLAVLLEYLAEQQRDDGSWGSPPHDLFATLALMASAQPKYRRAVERSARFHAETTSSEDSSSLINWRYMTAGIVLAEYYLQHREAWVLPELQEIYEFLMSSQYLEMSQIHPQARQTHPDSVPKTALQSHGGWGHNPGFEGYGPIAMITSQGALTLSLMQRCGIKVDRKRMRAAFEFIKRGTGKNGYLWYGDQVAGDENWADMGRTGAAGIANWICPLSDEPYRERALAHAAIIGAHPLSFPDTHGSPTMGMAFTALAAHCDPQSFRRLMDANRWWFTLSECIDGTFYYQPNRDNAGYGGDSRLSASAVTAFIFSMPKRNLHVTGKPFAK